MDDDDLSLKVVCPKCGAIIDEKCFDRTPNPPEITHPDKYHIERRRESWTIKRSNNDD